MKLLKVIQPENLTVEEIKKFRPRTAVRAIVFDKDNKIGLLNVTKHGYYKLPGGGIKEGEDKITALKRECLEEIGCDVEITKEIGSIIEHRGQFKMTQKSFCYLAKLSGSKGKPNFTKREIQDGFEDMWVKLEEAIDLLRNNISDDYQGGLVRTRDSIYLKEAKKLIK